MKNIKLPIIRKSMTLTKKRAAISKLNQLIYIDKSISLEKAINHLRDLVAFERYMVLHKGNYSGILVEPRLSKDVLVIEHQKYRHYIEITDSMTHLVLENIVPGSTTFFKKEHLTEKHIKELELLVLRLGSLNAQMHMNLNKINNYTKQEKL